MPDNNIVWGDPPAHKSKNPATAIDWVSILTPLMQRPGKWARVYVYKSSTGAYGRAWLLRTRQRPIPDGKWEFAARPLDDSVHAKWGLYARYLGAEDK